MSFGHDAPEHADVDKHNPYVPQQSPGVQIVSRYASDGAPSAH